MIEIFKNATIVYTDGVKERFDAIYMTEKMAIIGRIFKINGTELFKECKFILRQDIKQIYDGSKRKIQNMKS